MTKDQQLAEAIAKELMYMPPDFYTIEDRAAAILPLISEFKKEVAGEAWDICSTRKTQERYFIQLGPHIEITAPDRATYIDKLNK